MATEFTEVVVEGVTLAIPRQHNNSDSLASKDEVDIDNDVIQVVEQEIEMDDGNRLVITTENFITADDTIVTTDSENIIITETNGDIIEHDHQQSDSDTGDSEIQVYNLDTDEATSIHIPDDESSNYVVINAEESSIMPLLNNDQAFVIKKPKLSDLNDKNDGKARPYKCDICGTCFTKSEVLKRHKRSHNVKKDFSCTFCNLSFHRRDCLTDHMRNHTGEKPFQCTICNKKFTRGFVLLRHMRIHSDGDFKCKVCHKSFDRRDTFNDHMRNHTGEKPYKCRFCSKSFSRSFVLTKHEKNHAAKLKSRLEEEQEGKVVINNDDIEYDNPDDITDLPTKILLPREFTQGVIEETAIELEEEETHLEDVEVDGEQVLEEVYSILPDHDLQSQVLITEPIQEEVVVQTENISLSTSDGQLIKMITKDQYKKLIEAAEKNSKLFKCQLCNKNFTSDSTFQQHFDRPWAKGGCLPST